MNEEPINSLQELMSNGHIYFVNSSLYATIRYSLPSFLLPSLFPISLSVTRQAAYLLFVRYAAIGAHHSLAGRAPVGQPILVFPRHRHTSSRSRDRAGTAVRWGTDQARAWYALGTTWYRRGTCGSKETIR